MKLATKIMAGTAALALLTLAAGSLQAQVTNVITLSLSVSVQGNSTDVNGVTIAAAPIKHTVATKDILGFLAQAENAEGNYLAGTTFPTGAKLVVISSSNNNNPVFQVLAANNSFLVDVSDIITSADGTFGNDIYSGKQNDTTLLAATSETDLHILTMQYDDTWIMGSQDVKFYVTGLMTSTTTDTVPNATTSVYTESQSHKLASGTGEGTYQGQPFVLTGTMSATGKATLIY